MHISILRDSPFNLSLEKVSASKEFCHSIQFLSYVNAYMGIRNQINLYNKKEGEPKTFEKVVTKV
jgi:hypothetical protein